MSFVLRLIRLSAGGGSLSRQPQVIEHPVSRLAKYDGLSVQVHRLLRPTIRRDYSGFPIHRSEFGKLQLFGGGLRKVDHSAFDGRLPGVNPDHDR